VGPLTLTCAWPAILFFALPALAADSPPVRPASRVLLLGIDGCRTDALRAAKVPNLRALIDAGAFSERTNIVGTRGDSADTVSGPGWSNLLTGVWADKHGVLNNDFKVSHYDEYPHFFRLLKQVFPQVRTASYCTWPSIQKRMVVAADESLCFFDDDKLAHLSQADEKCTAKAVDVLTHGDPDAMFVYLGAVDETGHRLGFHPSVPEYLQAIETVDGQVGRMLAALHARPHCEAEHWLVLVMTDHGGRGTGHSGGREIAEINTVWLIVSGAAAERGSIDGPTHHVDVVATALTHLAAPINPDWKLDGRAVGLKKPYRAGGKP
jgi:predicted AlkP superfamily pyrophosphatase or phosphodiesterase